MDKDMQRLISDLQIQVPREARLEQLAEEATELAKAALKLARYYRGENPVAPELDLFAMAANLMEEYNDVLLTARVAGGVREVPEWQMRKARRWADRMKQAADDGGGK